MKSASQFYGVATLILCLSAHHTLAAKPELEILVLFDNTSAREDLRRSWEFSALIDFRGHRVLFDAGSDPILLLLIVLIGVNSNAAATKDRDERVREAADRAMRHIQNVLKVKKPVATAKATT